jgi:hypothetical protein
VTGIMAMTCLKEEEEKFYVCKTAASFSQINKYIFRFPYQKLYVYDGKPLVQKGNPFILVKGRT